MKILRYVNALSICALIGSAVYAYSISYRALYYAAQIEKLKDQIQRQHDDIDILRAEWAHRVRPQRLQDLAEANLGLQPLNLNQIVSFSDLPNRAPRVDTIGHELETLGLAKPTSTPKQRAAGGASTPQR